MLRDVVRIPDPAQELQEHFRPTRREVLILAARIERIPHAVAARNQRGGYYPEALKANRYIHYTVNVV